jgi:hypothetical protein
MVDSGVIMINIHDSYQGGVCVGVVPLLTVEMQKAGFFYVDHVIWDKQNNKPQGNDTKRFMNGYESTTSATYTNNDWLITPVLQLTGNERLNFWIKKEGETYFPDLAIYVLDMNNGDVNATDSISNFTLLANIPNNTISTTYQQQEVDLSSLNGQYRLAFVRLQPSQYDLYIDEVKVSSLPNCRRVSDVALSNVSHEEATITWTPGQTTDAAWNIYLTQGSSTITIPVTQIPTTITNLLPNTDYSFVVKTERYK